MRKYQQTRKPLSRLERAFKCLVHWEPKTLIALACVYIRWYEYICSVYSIHSLSRWKLFCKDEIRGIFVLLQKVVLQTAVKWFWEKTFTKCNFPSWAFIKDAYIVTNLNSKSSPFLLSKYTSRCRGTFKINNFQDFWQKEQICSA